MNWCVPYLWSTIGRSGLVVRHIPPLLWVCSMTRLFLKLRGPYLWPQATSGPNPLVSELLPGPRAPAACRCNSLLPQAAAPRACVTVSQTSQGRFDQALMQAPHGVARCLTIACQGLQEQLKEPLSEDSLVGAYTLGRHFANSMRVPMKTAVRC